MSFRDDMILEKAALEAEVASRDKDLGFVERFKRRYGKRTKIGYKSRVLLFILVACTMMLVYLASFATGSSIGVELNAATDAIVKWVIDLFTAGSASSGHGAGAALSRLATFGPVSYIIVSSALSAIIVGVFSICYSRYKTRRMKDNRTPNLALESDALGWRWR